MSNNEKVPFTRVVIIGAGFSGVAMACQLQRKLGCNDYAIYDRSPSPGGTWWANQYPGCAVDIPAVFYSLSFAPNPNFSMVFPPQAEVLDYFNQVVRKFDVERHIVLNMEWEGAYWQDSSNTWLVKLRDLMTGEIKYQQCSILISAVGGLVNPNPFDVPGVAEFQGDIVHTARWKPDLSLSQKNVIVVGNGCSAAQLIPAIVGQAKSISQFIRTPQHYLQNDNFKVNETWRFVFRYVPGVLLLLRFLVFLYLESTAVRFRLNSGTKYRNQSAKGSKAYIQENAPEKYWPLLSPKYEIGCKTTVSAAFFDNSKYISCLQRDNVHLTDDPITELQSHAVVTKSGRRYPADVILLATGFSLTQYDVELVGRCGRTRSQHWEEYGYKEAYKTIAMSQFPNFFYVLGPNSGKGHTSTIYSIENYVDLICRVIRPVLHDQAPFVEVKVDSERRYNENLHAAIEQTIFDDSCFSYFIDKKCGKNWFIYPWSSFEMWYDTHVGGGSDWIYKDQDNRGKPFIFSTIFSMTLVSLIILFLSSATTIGSLVANILADGPYAKLVRRRL